jgi:hypothetical protein
MGEASEETPDQQKIKKETEMDAKTSGKVSPEVENREVMEGEMETSPVVEKE